ncbi:hypothetical protein [Phaeobacter inhibens]|uniref:hypothetical protein n=1 Tax=Phaeobacter inhibens TaxID=221822 RepID=UPI000F46D27B|nr:hypothetical protein [Phaeobacter inhibens]
MITSQKIDYAPAVNLKLRLFLQYGIDPMNFLTRVTVCLGTVLSLSACMEGGSSSSRPPKQLSFQDVAAMELYQRGGDRPFFDGGLAAKRVSAAVLFVPGGAARHDAVRGNAVYFQVTVGTSESTFRPPAHLPSSVFAGLSKPELVALHSDLTSGRMSGRVLELAKTAARQTICAAGTVSLDDRPIREGVPLTPQQQARVNAALGGRLDRILEMKKEDLDRLGIGFVLNRETRPVPNFYYRTYRYSGTKSALLRMKCLF